MAEYNRGILYMVATPIGNMEDMTLRALKVLKSVDLIASENVNHSKKLCNYYGISTRIISYNQHNHRIRGPEIIKKILSGMNVAYITNAGTPGVSDPGSRLVNLAMESGIKVSPIPGASALTCAISISGFRSDGFVFSGFLPTKKGKRRRELEDFREEKRTIVIFESPHRIDNTLKDILEILGDRIIVIARELTKTHEEIKKGPISQLIKEISPDKKRGEFTILIQGA
jgi:16S rRNA (cytidine1402-2'-O)-methyltransferase